MRNQNIGSRVPKGNVGPVEIQSQHNTREEPEIEPENETRSFYAPTKSV